MSILHILYIIVLVIYTNLVSSNSLCYIHITHVSLGNDRSLGADLCIKTGVRYNVPLGTVYSEQYTNITYSKRIYSL